MRSSVTLWAVMALLILTLPFNPVLNQPGLALAVFVVAAVIAGFAFNTAMVEDIDNHLAQEDEL